MLKINYSHSISLSTLFSPLSPRERGPGGESVHTLIEGESTHTLTGDESAHTLHRGASAHQILGGIRKKFGNEAGTFSSGSTICIRFKGYYLSSDSLETPLKFITKLKHFV
jgi:hypothetical protein